MGKASQPGFFDEQDRRARLTVLGDPLEKVAGSVDFESFRPVLDKLVASKPAKGPGGRPRFDAVMMFKVLLLQQWYGLADEKTEYQINDRVSFQRFLGLGLGDRVPDATTIWLFREQLGPDGCEALFGAFAAALDQAGVTSRKGVIVDATFVDVPRQRNTRGQNQAIKAGLTPEGWDQPGAARMVAQKDVDARWAVKNIVSTTVPARLPVCAVNGIGSIPGYKPAQTRRTGASTGSGSSSTPARNARSRRTPLSHGNWPGSVGVWR